VAAAALESYTYEMDRFSLEGGVAAAFSLIDAANGYIASTEPWALARDPVQADRLSQVLFDVAESLRVAAVLLLPVMPGSAAEILRRVGVTTPVPELRLADARWNAHGARTLIKGDALWPRLESHAGGGAPAARSQSTGSKRSTELSDTNQTTGTPAAAAPAAQAAPAVAAPAPATSVQGTDRITIDDFMKVDLRVAKVLTAEKVPNSRKLVKLSIDVGSEQRTLVAGIAEAYEPEALIGRTIVMVFNLKPAKLMGIESNGMVLAASPDGGKPSLVGFDQEVPPGTRVR
jgi:methionyl-tRNA synthetase